MTSDHQCNHFDVSDFEVRIQTQKNYSTLIISTPGGYGQNASAIYLSPAQLDHLIVRVIEAKRRWVEKEKAHDMAD